MIRCQPAGVGKNSLGPADARLAVWFSVLKVINFSIVVDNRYYNIYQSPKMRSLLLCPFGTGTLASQKKREKLFWEWIFALLNLKRKINME